MKPAGPRGRHEGRTAVDAERARKLLEDRRKDLEESLQAARADAGLDEAMGDSLGEIAPNDEDADVGTEMFEREKAVSIVESIEGRIAEVEDALRRVDDGTFGRCEVCEQPIKMERLKVRPETRYCVEHQQEVMRA